MVRHSPRQDLSGESIDAHKFEEDPQGALQLFHEKTSPSPDERGRQSFEWRSARKAFAGISIAVVSWRATSRLATLSPDQYNLVIPLEGQGRARTGQHTIVLAPQRKAALFSPGAPLEVISAPGLQLMHIGLASERLRSHMIKVTEYAHGRPIRFEPELDLLAEGPRCVCQLAALLKQEVQRGRWGRALCKNLIDALLTALLTQLPHNGKRAMEPAPLRLTPGYLHRAEEYMVTNLAEPITMRALAERAGVSVRTLQGAFQTYHQRSPMGFLMELRLQAARRCLLAPPPAQTVASTARDVGFQHLGRFSARYRERFNEPPSATLARARAMDPSHAPVTGEQGGKVVAFSSPRRSPPLQRVAALPLLATGTNQPSSVRRRGRNTKAPSPGGDERADQTAAPSVSLKTE